MKSYTITEEPIDPPAVQEVLARQDDNLKIDASQFVHRVRYDTLKLQIREAEADLFRMKRQLEDLRVPVHGKVVIPAPNSYRCDTCGNTKCLNHDLEGAEGRIIRNQTTMNGCLTWLPEASK